MVTLDLVRDEAERTVELDDDFAAALTTSAAAQKFFDGLSYSQKRWFTLGLADAKKPETRARRIESTSRCSPRAELAETGER